MGATYLFGDSTPANFDHDVIDLLRSVLAFSVDVISRSARIQDLHKQEIALRRLADGEIEKLEELPGVVGASLDDVAAGTTAQCVAKIKLAAEAVVVGEVAAVNAKLATDVAKISDEEGRERDAMAKSLKLLLARHGLPRSESHQEVRFEGTRYVGNVTTRSEDLGLDAIIACEPPAGHALSQAVRVERLAPGLEIQVPEPSGFFRKELKPRPQRIGHLCVTTMQENPDGVTLTLRGEGGGYDIAFAGTERDVAIARVAEGGSPIAFDLEKGDAAKLVAMLDVWLDLADGLLQNPTELVAANFDEAPYRDAQEPTALVERLISAIAPDIEEVARRTPGKNELTIKRVIDGNRREEVYISKSELKTELEKLPPAMRSAFRPLGLEVVMPSLLPPPSSAPLSAPAMAVSDNDLEHS